MKARYFILLACLVVALSGCASSGTVDTGAVQKQADKEKEINQAAQKNLPPGEGPAG